MLGAVLALAVCAAPLEVSRSPEPTSPPSWALEVRLGAPSVFSALPLLGAGSPGVVGGLGGIGLGSFTPTTSLFAARALDAHWAVELGLGASGSLQLGGPPTDAWSASAQAMVKWFPARAFDGLWLGAGVPVSASRSVSTFTSDAGTARAELRSFSVGVDALVGWSLTFAERFFATFALGPAFRWTGATSTVSAEPAPVSTGQLAVTGASFLGVGVTL
jgi:hypothetical protein